MNVIPTVRILTSLEEFITIKDDWGRLLNQSANPSITLTWEWLATWWKIYGKGRELRIVEVREDGDLIAIAPILKRNRRSRYYNFFSFSTLELLATGEDEGPTNSDYLDLILRRGRERESLEAILQVLLKELQQEWDEIILRNVSEDSLTVSLLEEICKRRDLHFSVRRKEPCLFIQLPGSWQGFLESIGSNLRYKIRRGRKEFEAAGGKYWSVESSNQLDKAIGILVDLHQQRWTHKGESGAFANPYWAAFHKTLIPQFFEKGWVQLSFLELNGQAIAAIYNFKYEKRVFFYQSGILIPQESQHIRPGLLLHSYCIEEAIHRGMIEYDFLKKGRSEYKSIWANKTRNLLEIRISKKTARNSLFLITWQIVGHLRRIKSICEGVVSAGKRDA